MNQFEKEFNITCADFLGWKRRGMVDELIPDKLYIDWTPELIRQDFKKGKQ